MLYNTIHQNQSKIAVRDDYRNSYRFGIVYVAQIAIQHG